MRISVIGGCNLSCLYCDHEGRTTKDILSQQDVATVLKAAKELEIDSVKFTGGEPLLHPQLEEIIAIARKLNFSDIGLTTNGTLLSRNKCNNLRDAGLMRVNINLPSINRTTYFRITGVDCFDQLVENIKYATGVFKKLKLNMVVLKGYNDNEIFDMISFISGMKGDVTLQLIELHPLGAATDRMDLKCDLESVERKIASMSSRKIVREMQNRPVYKVDDVYVEFIRLSNTFCEKCNKIRVMADGTVLPCLFAKNGFSLRVHLRAGDIDATKRILLDAISRKIMGCYLLHTSGVQGNKYEKQHHNNRDHYDPITKLSPDAF